MSQSIRLVPLLCILLWRGCSEISIKTTVNTDGTFVRSVVCNGDSSDLSAIHLPYVFDSTWSITTVKKTDGEHTSSTTATKIYPSSNELTAEFTRGKDSTKLSVSCHIKKAFRWFFTYFRYTEILHPYARYHHEPVDSFFTPEEIGRLRMNQDSSLSKRVEAYWVRNSLDEYVDRIALASKGLGDTALSSGSIAIHKKEIVDALARIEGGKAKDIFDAFNSVVHPRPQKRLFKVIDSVFASLTKEIEAETALDISYTNEVTMPGILLGANSKSIEGNRVTWNCHSNQYFDVTMTAESRRVNLWAVIATGVVCLLLLGGLLIPIVYRSRG